MATYKVILKTAAFAYVQVKADNAEEAADLAYEQAPDICAQCSGWGKGYQLELNEVWEVDGEPELADGDGDSGDE